MSVVHAWSCRAATHQVLQSIDRLGTDPSPKPFKMLSALSVQLHARRVVLASQSPRRLELLRDCVRSRERLSWTRWKIVTGMSSVAATAQGLTFDVIPSTFEENLPKERFATPVRPARLRTVGAIGGGLNPSGDAL